MLILPLHKPLTRETFPMVTAVLIVLNLLVFMLFQSGDDRARERALDHYQQHQLNQIEFPAYLDWLPEDRRQQLDQQLGQAEPARSIRLFSQLQADGDFQQALAADQVITREHPDYARWKRDRGEFDRQWSAAFTEQWFMRYGEIAPARMFAAMFLHGDWGHLIGNMLFLALLGLLVEGALGPALFISLYLLGGLGGQVFSLYWRWGEVGGLLGASGAIAALMGAFCVLWGMRRVRFFYWLVVIFDYVRAPALWLLLPWLGWELASMVLNPDAGIGFDAHAGGMMAGALLAVGVRRMGWEKREFMDEDERGETDLRLREQAAAAMGALNFGLALTLYDQLAAAHPEEAEIQVARYRAAKYQQPPAQIDRAASAVLALRGPDAVTTQQLHVWNDYMEAKAQRPSVSASALFNFLERLIDGGRLEPAERLLQALARMPTRPARLPQLALALVRQLPAQAPSRAHWLTWLQTQKVDPAAAEKARLISELAAASG